VVKAPVGGGGTTSSSTGGSSTGGSSISIAGVPTVSAAPEPASALLALAGSLAAGLGACRRRRRPSSPRSPALVANC
jgi:hypothetical protein